MKISCYLCLLSLKISCIAIILFAKSVAFSQALSKSDSTTIDTAIDTLMAKMNIPGFAACMVNNNSIIWSKAYGEADIKHHTPMSLDGIMNIGSISKTFTTVAAMQLWEKGLLDLDADINTYLDFEIKHPKYPEKQISIFQILTHTSSICDGKAYGDSYNCGDPSISLQEWIFNYLTPKGKYYNKKENFGDWSPGEKGKYSNVAFGFLGLIVENVAKKPFNIYCHEHIFKPLGMVNTGWLLSEIDTSKHIKPYMHVTKENRNYMLKKKKLFPNEFDFREGNLVECCLYSFPNYPDGLVRTSIRELSYYLTAIMNGGILNNTRILKKESVDKMLTLQIEGNNSQGLTWYSTTFETSNEEVTLWGHNGGDPGISTNMYFHPTKNIGFITFQNNSTGGGFQILKELYQTTADH